MTKLVILDRDGVVNYDSANYIKSAEEWHAIPGSLEAIARLNQAGYRIVIATNQSGLSRGLFTPDDLTEIHLKMHRELAAVGGHIEAIFFCPHADTEQCQCRKPKPGLLHDIANRLGLSLSGVYLVGDALRDLQAAIVAGARPVLVLTGKGRKTLADLEGFKDVLIYDDLAAFVDALLTTEDN
ncbi:D-glycero-beta-D-manno-heptose 1,7-bisphosphate 7-phosphatase [Thioflexithrix psekupsensis]|uniref:D,D-heptose 1,7-bisphosphate phosphatase n=1 Tax=Thioflexithrix psekupsensis TaxID=1570016 RepID=A0A251X4R8_9GAMM|nr:D-glycero-beta-D-manno-heptose-1,7-bisphosphate 7-phosphatase [Thioflexithrix psekupsensis]